MRKIQKPLPEKPLPPFSLRKPLTVLEIERQALEGVKGTDNNMMRWAAKCHPRSSLIAEYYIGTGVMWLRCAKCKNPIVSIQL